MVMRFFCSAPHSASVFYGPDGKMLFICPKYFVDSPTPLDKLTAPVFLKRLPDLPVRHHLLWHRDIVHFELATPLTFDMMTNKRLFGEEV